MTEAWKKQKAYLARKSAAFMETLESALATKDFKLFKEIYPIAYQYTTKKQRGDIYIRFLKMYSKSN